MSLGRALQDELSPQTGRGRVRAEGADGDVVVDVVESDRLGATVDRVRVRVSGSSAPLERQADDLCRRVRHLGERLVPHEVDPRLGGGVLRSDPADMRGREYYEVGLDGTGATVERYRARDEGGRDREPFTLTREQLERLVDDLGDGLRDPEEAG